MNKLSLIAETIEILEEENPSLHSTMNYSFFSQSIAERRDLPLSSIPSEEDYNSALGVLTFSKGEKDKNKRLRSIISFFLILIFYMAGVSAFILGMTHEDLLLFIIGIALLGYGTLFIHVIRKN